MSESKGTSRKKKNSSSKSGGGSSGSEDSIEETATGTAQFLSLTATASPQVKKAGFRRAPTIEGHDHLRRTQNTSPVPRQNKDSLNSSASSNSSRQSRARGSGGTGAGTGRNKPQSDLMASTSSSAAGTVTGSGTGSGLRRAYTASVPPVPQGSSASGINPYFGGGISRIGASNQNSSSANNNNNIPSGSMNSMNESFSRFSHQFVRQGFAQSATEALPTESFSRDKSHLLDDRSSDDEEHSYISSAEEDDEEDKHRMRQNNRSLARMLEQASAKKQPRMSTTSEQTDVQTTISGIRAAAFDLELLKHHESVGTHGSEEVEFDWDGPFAPPNFYGTGQFSFGTVGLARQSTVGTRNSGGSRRDENPNGTSSSSTTRGFLSNWFGRNKQCRETTHLGSTILARFGKKYQVDQTVNLMDMEHATASMKDYQPTTLGRQPKGRRVSIRQYPHPQNQRRESFFKTVLNLGSHDMEDVALDGHSSRPGSRRQSFIQVAVGEQLNRFAFDDEDDESCCQKLRSCLARFSLYCCSLPTLMVIIAMGATLALVLPLIEDYQTYKAAASSVPLPATSVPTSLTKPVVAPTAAPLTAAQKKQPSMAVNTTSIGAPPENLDSGLAGSGAAKIESARDDGGADSSPPTFSPTRIGPPPSLTTIIDRERWEVLKGMIIQHSVSPASDFDNPHSSISKALEWMVAYDVALEFISSDPLVMNHLLEVYALAVFHFSTNPLATPRDVENNFEPPPPHIDWIHHSDKKVCRWDGISCGHLGNVVMLNLSSRGLEGTLPKELKVLHHLVDMDLSHNRIGGTLPSEWGGEGQMEHLKMVNLSHNDLEGPIPESWRVFEEQLELLDLNENERLEVAD